MTLLEMIEECATEAFETWKEDQDNEWQAMITGTSHSVAPSAAPTESMFIDWLAFWRREREPAEWVFPNVLARGRGHSLYAAKKTGKSLFMLFVAAWVTTSRTDTMVVYLDYEMTEDDLHERLDDMGYGGSDDLSRLQYALLPSLPPLDTRQGASALFAVLDALRAEHPELHLVVILDTTSRATAGPENDADTIRNFYRFTGIGLKQRGMTWARLDHAGKDAGAGTRGTSAKGDDVDVVWKLTRTDNGIELVREVARMNWVPESVVFVESGSPLRFAATGTAWPKGTVSCATALDELGVSVDATASEATSALRHAGQSSRKQVVLAALKYRRRAVPEFWEPTPREPSTEPLSGSAP